MNMNENENENENVICDLSVGLSRQHSQARTSRAIDLASDTYRYDHECFNSGLLGLKRDKRVLDSGNPLINELVMRRESYLKSSKVKAQVGLGEGLGVGSVSKEDQDVCSNVTLEKGFKYKQD